MRMTRRVRRDERGAILIIVGVFTMVMVAMTAFVVDMGNQRQNRLQLTTATDASALAVAQTWANAKLVAGTAGFSNIAGEPMKFDCKVVARNVVRANNEGLDPDSVSCIAELKEAGQWGVVTVAATEKVPYQFAQAMGGSTSGTTRATTSVKVTSAARGGLRPWAICANLPEIRNFINGTAVDDVKIDAVKFLTPQCGQASGNWGLLDLGGNGASAVGQLFAEGYNKPVKVSSAKDVCAETVPESCFDASPGAKWNSGPIGSALDFLDGANGCENGGPEFSVPVYEQVLHPNGKNAQFPLTGFLRVQLMCFSTGGSNLNSLTVKLLSYNAEECCSGVTSNNQILEICDVGTIGGELGADFSSTCGVRTDPPLLDSDCEVIPIDPPNQDVVVDPAGKSVADLLVNADVEDVTKCGTIKLKAVPHGSMTHDANSVFAISTGRTHNTFHFRFPAGSSFGVGGTNLTLIVYEDDFVWDQSANIRTVDDPGTAPVPARCEVIKVSPATVTVPVDNSSKKTTAPVTWYLEFAWPSNCGQLTGKLVSGSHQIGVGTTDTSAVKQFTLPKGTEFPSGLHQNGSFDVKFFAGTTQLVMPVGTPLMRLYTN